MDRLGQCPVESWLDEALTPTPLPPGMSSRELVRRAVTFARPPRLPYAFIGPVRSDFFELAALQRVTDAVRHGAHGTVYCDEWGVGRASSPHAEDPVVAHPLSDLTLLDRHRFPEASTLLSLDRLAPVVRRACDAGKYVVAADPVSLYGRLESLLGFATLLVAPRRAPDPFTALLDRLAELTLDAITLVSRLPGIDAFMTWQDLASQRGSHLSLDTFRRFFKPRYARIVDAAHAKGLHVIWHICGGVTTLIPELVDLGVDVLQLDQPRLLGHALLAERFGGALCFWNTIDTQWAGAAPRSTADIRAEAAAMVRPFADLPGGLMLRHYPFPEAIGLSVDFQEHSARAFVELAGVSRQV